MSISDGYFLIVPNMIVSIAWLPSVVLAAFGAIVLVALTRMAVRSFLALMFG